MYCFDAYVLFKKPCEHNILVGAFFSAPNTGFGIVTDNQHFEVYGIEKLKFNLPDWTPDTYPTNFCCLFEAPLATRNQTMKNQNLFIVWSLQFIYKVTDSPKKSVNKLAEKTVAFAETVNSEQKSTNQQKEVSLPALLLVGFDEDSMSLVVKSVPSVFTAMQQHKPQFEQLVGCSVISRLVVRSDPCLSSLNVCYFELFFPDHMLAMTMILSMLSLPELLNAMVTLTCSFTLTFSYFKDCL